MRQGARISWVGLVAVGMVAAGVAGCNGKGAEGTCGETASCGGDPSGTWTVNGSCSFDPLQPFRQMSLTELSQPTQNPSLAPMQPQPTTDGNWCFDLYLLPPDTMHPGGNLLAINLWHDAPALTGGTLTFDPAGTYNVDLTFLENNATTHFPESCIQFAGAGPTCAQLGTLITAYYANIAGTNPPTFQGINCQAGAPDGCDCFYNYSVELTDTGAWTKSDNVLIESSLEYLYNGQKVESQAPSGNQAASFCQSSTDALTLTGYNGTSLSVVAGLRTLDLKRKTP
jgi:hypothetical protein